MIKARLVPPGRALEGALVLPGSKSITNRALLLAGLAKGESLITGALKSDDTQFMKWGLWHMGVRTEEPDATSFRVKSFGRLMRPERDIVVGNAGTAMRFLTAAAAACEGKVLIDGDPHMRQRPIQPLVDALKSLGVEVSAPTGCPPVTVMGQGAFPSGKVTIDASLSSQYVSAILMAAGRAKGPVDIALKGKDIGARGYVDLTIKVMEAFGQGVETTGENSWRVTPTGYTARDYQVEPDASAATYPWAWAAITGGRIGVGVEPEDFMQPDAKAHALIAAFPNMPAKIDGSQIQDAVPTLAVLAAYNETPVRFTGIANLRVKECDRIAALEEGLNRIRPGIAEVKGDDLIVRGDPSLRGADAPVVIDPRGDHRMVMAFAVAGLATSGIVIDEPQAVKKTWPTYFDVLRAVGVTVEHV